MNITEDDRRLAKAACVGAGAALVLSMFAPAAVLLGAGLLTAGGVVAYKRYASTGDRKDGKQGDVADGADGTNTTTTEGK